MRFHGSKALILFTRRFMPAELRLQSDRGTQKSEIYFTDYTLAGQPDAFPSQESELRLGGLGQALGEALLCKALANFISPITLWLDNRMLSPPKSQSCD